MLGRRKSVEMFKLHQHTRIFCKLGGMAVEIIPGQGGEWEFRQIGALLESAIPPQFH
jgi:hypothetical protein